MGKRHQEQAAKEPRSPAAPNATRQVNDVDYMDREEALKILGIKKESLYTYVSRGLIKTIAEPGKKARLYRKVDIEKLRTRAGAKPGGQRIAQVLRYGEPVVQTWICEITKEGPRYRGHLATSLVRDGYSFEYAANLIWGGLPPVRDVPWPTSEATNLLRLDLAAVKGAHEYSPLKAFALAAMELSALEERDPNVQHLDARTCGIRLLDVFAGMSGYLGPRMQYQKALPNEFVSQRLMNGLGLRKDQDPAGVQAALTAALVLSVDNELSPPTFAARICSSTGVDLYACVVAALMAQAGPMQIGGTTDLVELLEEILKTPGAMPRSGSDIPCFGHPLYDRDPRSEVLMSLIRALSGKRPIRDKLIEFVDQVQQRW